MLLLGLAALVGVMAGAGCSSGDDASTAPQPTSAAAASSVAPTPSTSDLDESSTVPADTRPPESPVPPPAVIPDTGVPGLDSADGFCRAWSEFAGSFQALALASARAERITAARAEVAASSVIIEAVEALDAELPAELESEREALTVGLVGPMARRAQTALDGLQSAGADSGQVGAIGDAWLAALTQTGLDDPNIAVAVDADVDDLLDVAAASFASTAPPIANDPSLITDAATPLTFAFLSANCPDQGILGGNDIVDQP